MDRKILTVEQQLKRYKRRFFITLSSFLCFIALTGVYIYLNYDYLAFKHFIAQNYIYTDTLDQLYKKELNKDVKGRYYSYFDNVVISVMTRSIREINNDKYTYLFTPESYITYQNEEKQDALQSEVKELDASTVYMRITNFSKYTQTFLQENVQKLKNYPNLIIDLRDNYGGATEALYKMAGLFLPKGSVISSDSLRFFNWTNKSKGDQTLSFKKIIILQNRNTASSAENFIAGLKDHLNNVTLIGENTFGKGIGQFTLPLKRGFAVKATVMLWYTPKGVNIQGKGIPPDVQYTGEDIVQYSLQKYLK